VPCHLFEFATNARGPQPAVARVSQRPQQCLEIVLRPHRLPLARQRLRNLFLRWCGFEQSR